MSKSPFEMLDKVMKKPTHPSPLARADGTYTFHKFHFLRVRVLYFRKEQRAELVDPTLSLGRFARAKICIILLECVDALLLGTEETARILKIL
jgi:hypothetical protein